MNKRVLAFTLFVMILLTVLPVSAEEGPTFFVDTVECQAGDMVSIPIRIKNNPGIASAKMKIGYDSKLTLTNVIYNTLIGGQFQKPQKLSNPVTLNWFNGTENVDGDFLYATLEFKVSEDAEPGDYGVTVSYEQENVYDIDENDIPFSIQNGGVKILAQQGEPAQLIGNSLTLEGQIGVNFYVKLPEQLKNITAKLTFSGNSGAEKNIPLDASILTSNGYRITYEVVAKEMNDIITLTLVDENGGQVPMLDKKGQLVPESGYTYSVKDYFDVAAGTGNAKLHDLVNTMSDYGSCAQKYLGYQTGSALPVRGDLNSVTKAQLAPFMRNVTGTLPQDLEFVGMSLVLNSRTDINVYFRTTQSISDYQFKLDSQTVVPAAKSGMYCVTIPNIAAKDMDKTHTVTVNDQFTVSCSGLSYAYTTLEHPEKNDLCNLVKAIYLYNVAAKTYFNK